MKVYVIANLDDQLGPELYDVHKTLVQAEISLDIIKKKEMVSGQYIKIYERELEE